MATSKENEKKITEEVSNTIETFFYDKKLRYPFENSFTVLEELGCLIYGAPLESDISGFYNVKAGIPCIYINTAHSLGRQNFSAWHEFYHHISGETSSISYIQDGKKDVVEEKADLFAGMILMPSNLIEEQLKKLNVYDPKYTSYDHIIKMQHYFKVSYSAIVKRLIQLYPDANLNNRFGIANKKRSQELIEKTIALGFSTALITPTNDIYLSPTFFDDLDFNLTHGRISEEKVEEVIQKINGKIDGDIYE